LAGIVTGTLSCGGHGIDRAVKHYLHVCSASDAHGISGDLRVRDSVPVELNGCLIKPHTIDQQDVLARVVKDYHAILSVGEPISGPIDLYEAVARALKYNLDAKVKTMQAQLAHQQLNVANYSLPPQVSANAGYDGRNNFSGGVGRSLVTGRQAVEPFTSQWE